MGLWAGHRGRQRERSRRAERRRSTSFHRKRLYPMLHLGGATKTLTSPLRTRTQVFDSESAAVIKRFVLVLLHLRIIIINHEPTPTDSYTQTFHAPWQIGRHQTVCSRPRMLSHVLYLINKNRPVERSCARSSANNAQGCTFDPLDANSQGQAFKLLVSF